METVVGEFPIEKVEIFGRSQSVYLHRDAKLSSVVDMTLFKGFWPGITAEEAMQVAGEPDAVITKSIVPPDSRRGDFYYYDRGRAVVRVSRTISGSGGMPDRVGWNLYLFPKEGVEAAIVFDDITDLYNEETREFFVMSSDESLHIVVRNGGLKYIVWEKGT